MKPGPNDGATSSSMPSTANASDLQHASPQHDDTTYTLLSKQSEDSGNDDAETRSRLHLSSKSSFEEGQFVEGMRDAASAGNMKDGFTYLESWGTTSSRIDAVKKEVDSPEQLNLALCWVCRRCTRHRKDVNQVWCKIWKILCDQVRTLLSRNSTNYPAEDRRRWFVSLVDDCMCYEFLSTAKAMPNTFGWPLIQALKTTAQALTLDVTSQCLVRPNEGSFLLWYCSLWERSQTNVFGSKVRWPAPDSIVLELYRVRKEEDVTFDQTEMESQSQCLRRTKRFVTNATNKSDFRSPRALSNSTVTPATPALLAGSTGTAPEFKGWVGWGGGTKGKSSSDLSSIFLWGEEDDDDDAEGTFTLQVHTRKRTCLMPRKLSCSSMLEALVRGLLSRSRSASQLARMRDILGIVMGNHDMCVDRLVVSPQLFFAFQYEEEAVVFLVYMLIQLNVQQMRWRFEALQMQIRRFIRFHSNPLFSCLQLTAAICRLCKRSGTAIDVWGDERARLKKAAVQIFELLPEESFNNIFRNTGQRQKFLALSFQEAECLEMMDTPRFQDYLHSRWNGGRPRLADVRNADDYEAYWYSLLDPNTLIFSPKVRLALNAVSFAFFTFFIQFYSGQFVSCARPSDWIHVGIVLWILGHVLRVVLGCGDFRKGTIHVLFYSMFDVVLAVLYFTIFLHCTMQQVTLSADTLQLLWGTTVGLMTLRWLHYLSCISRFGPLLRIIVLMTYDLLNFLVVYGAVILAWAMLFSRMRPDDPQFSSLALSIVTFFRASLTEFDLTGMIPGAEENGVEEWAGWVHVSLFCAFLLVTGVVLLNLLISMMNVTYTAVLARGNAESAQAFLDTISDGEKHSFWEASAVPPPVNLVYFLLLPFFFVGALVVALVVERATGRPIKRFKRYAQHSAPPVLMGLLFFPVALPAVAVTTLPSFVVLLLASSLVPLELSFLEVQPDFQSALDILRHHLLVPMDMFSRAYARNVGDRLFLLGFARYFVYPIACLGCLWAAIFVFIIIMPFYWVYEAVVRRMWRGTDTHEQLLREELSDVKKSSDDISTQVDNMLCEKRAQASILDLLAKGQLSLSMTDTAFAKLLGLDPADRGPEASELRAQVQAYFAADAHSVDLGMMYCFGRRNSWPDINAVQIERVFWSLHSHEERVEKMLNKILGELGTTTKLLKQHK